jgi:hypothetical protein
MALVHLCIPAALLMASASVRAEDSVWFGTLSENGTARQARFEIVIEGNVIRHAVLAPYGLTPTVFRDLMHDEKGLRFSLNRNATRFACVLRIESKSSFRGSCDAEKGTFSIVMREFSPEDAVLQGNARTADEVDMAIIARARTLLHNGASWNRRDDRVCDNSSYPYRWSLFCALHQASIEIGSEYQHLRPAMKAVRQAITNRYPDRKFAHTLRDFNNDARQFEAVSDVLDEAQALLNQQRR